MTDYYISKKREKYRNTYNMEGELQLPYTFEEKSLENVITKHIIMESTHIRTRFRRDDIGIDIKLPATLVEEDYFNFNQYNKYCYSLAEYIIIEMMKKGVDQQLAIETFTYYVNKDKSVHTDLSLFT